MVNYSLGIVEYTEFWYLAKARELDLINKFKDYCKSKNIPSRDQWTALKNECLLEVGSDIASVLSKLCSAFRAPDIALSCFRDASEKAIDVVAANSRINAANYFKDIFSKE